MAIMSTVNKTELLKTWDATQVVLEMRLGRPSKDEINDELKYYLDVNGGSGLNFKTTKGKLMYIYKCRNDALDIRLLAEKAMDDIDTEIEELKDKKRYIHDRKNFYSKKYIMKD